MADYSSLINGYFNSLFGRDAKEDGLAYWSDALNDPNSGVTIDNLEQSRIFFGWQWRISWGWCWSKSRKSIWGRWKRVNNLVLVDEDIS